MKRLAAPAHRRRSLRLRSYDYRLPDAYFVTTSTHGRVCLFGEVRAGAMRLNAFGEIVQHAWNDLPSHFPHVQLDAFIVMPDHVHGILIINDNNVGADVGAGLRPAPTTAPPTIEET